MSRSQPAAICRRWSARKRRRSICAAGWPASPSRKRPPSRGPCASDVDILDVAGVFLNEGESELGLLAHQAFDPLRRFAKFLDRHINAEQHPLLRVHRRFLELGGRHFTKTLEAADINLAAAGKLGREQPVFM